MNQKQLDTYFEHIFNELLKSLDAHNGGPFGAAIVKDNHIVSMGFNEVVKTYDISRHAEVVAISNATRQLSTWHLEGAVLLTSHLPCLMCYHNAKWGRIKSIYYIFDYAETEKLFGFRGDIQFMNDLSLAHDFYEHDPSVNVYRAGSERITDLYYKRLVDLWNSKYKVNLSGYDV